MNFNQSLTSTLIQIATVFVLLSGQSFASPAIKAEQKILTVRFPAPMADDDRRADYDRIVIDLALQKTVPKYGPYHLTTSVRMQQSRALASLKMNELVDVVPTTSSKEREQDFLPIRFDIHQGLMGVKLLLVRKDELEIYSRITRVEELKALVQGQGHDWPDAKIFRDAGFKVFTSPTYEGLFKMLATGRIHFFPRSVPEIWDEAQTYSHDKLVVEPTLAVVYHCPAFLFVNKRNTALASRLQEGLDLAVKDGSFHTAFIKAQGERIAQAKMKNRRVFHIDNSALPDEYRKTKPNIDVLYQ